MRDLYWWEWLLIGIAAFYMIVIVLYMRNLVVKKLSFLKDNQDESKVQEKWKPFVRYDRKTWSLCEIYFCAIFLLPIRIIMLGFCSILISLISCFCTCQKKGVDGTHIEQAKWKRVLFSSFLRFGVRFAMICLGVWWIPKKQRKITEFEPDYPEDKYKDRKDKCSIIVGNHIGYIEAVYFATTKYCPSFVAKKSVSKLPFLGGLGKTMQCIFVDRANNIQRNAVLESIEKRCQLIKEGKNFPPLAMFPEGTCSNGKYILSFKKGAFEPFAPVKTFFFKFYDRHFNNYLDSIPIGTHLLLTMCQIYNKIEVHEFDTYYPDHLNLKNPSDWKIYSEHIKNLMLKCGNLKNSDSGYRDVQDYEKYLKDYKHKVFQRLESIQLHRNFSNQLTIADRKDAIIQNNENQNDMEFNINTIDNSNIYNNNQNINNSNVNNANQNDKQLQQPQYKDVNTLQIQPVNKSFQDQQSNQGKKMEISYQSKQSQEITQEPQAEIIIQNQVKSNEKK